MLTMKLKLLLVVLDAACIAAAPADGRRQARFEKRDDLPTVTLSDATYQASYHDAVNDIYKFSNIRFAAPPVGDLRWKKPIAPPKVDGVQNGSYGNACPQAHPRGANYFGSAADIPAVAGLNEILAGLSSSSNAKPGNEDCLFLDVYVPGKALSHPTTAALPVIHWIYGGGYVSGSKDALEPKFPLYDGSGLIAESQGNVIFVASNYRLGAFGFLAGETMEKTGLPNAGLWDQRAALQWTRDNIGLFGGDPGAVTAFGESAGASSILHHLIGYGGQQDPLFHRAILQSPAFEPLFDRQGRLEDVYQNFSSLAGCPTGDITCLRQADSAVLMNASAVLNDGSPPGTFIVGASADGSFIRQTPALEYASGHYWKQLDGIIISHTSNESSLFVNGNIDTDAKFTSFVEYIFPKYAITDGLDARIDQQYSPVMGNSTFKTEGDRVRTVVRDLSFTCPTRFLSEAFVNRSYNLEYAVTPGWHATDLIPTFWSEQFSGSSPLATALSLAFPMISLFSRAYKSYITSFVRTGDPNTYRARISLPVTIDWPLAAVGTGEQISQVLQAGDSGFHLIDDDTNERMPCQFWTDLLAAMTAAGGYAPPDAVVSSPFTPANASASANYSLS